MAEAAAGTAGEAAGAAGAAAGVAGAASGGASGGTSGGRGARARWRRGSLRLRITLAAVAIVGVTLLVGAGVFAVVQRTVLDQGVRSTAVSDADRVLSRLQSGSSPEVAVRGAGTPDGALAVVLSADGSTILAAWGDPAAVQAYRALSAPQLTGTAVLGGESYALETSSGSYTPTPVPTITVGPPSSPGSSPTPGATPGTDDKGGLSGGGSGSSGGGSDDSSSGTTTGSTTGGTGTTTGTTTDDSGGDSGHQSGKGGSGSGKGGGSDDVGAPAPGTPGAGLASSVGLTGGGSDVERGVGRGGAVVRLASASGTATVAGAAAWPGGAGTVVAAGSGAGGPVPAVLAAAKSTDYVVAAGRSLAANAVTERATVTTLAVVIPLLLLVMAATTWLVVGRSLRPVERMRLEVEGITGAHLSARVAAPGGSDEISRLATTLNEMLDRLDGSARAQRRFVSDASHELRSPLAVMRQLAEVTRAYPGRIEPSLLADTVLTEGQRLADLVQGMLILARADEGQLEPSLQPVDVDDIVLAEATRLRAAGTTSVDTTAVSPARVRGDRGMLAQVVRNLADNAARHASGAVALSLSTAEGRVLVAVDDDGAGVPPDERERVFSRFVRLDEARAREAGGSGLGLAIVRSLVTAHGGSVRVTESASLGGARFEVELPVLDE